MKLSFLIYLILLFIDGLVAWQATGSPMLMVFPGVGIVFYGALSSRGGAVPEVVRILFSVLMITFGLVNFGNHLQVIFLTLLALPHFLAATQCVWEMQHAASEQAARTKDIRVSVFSMAFYASWGVAFLLLQADNLRLAWLHQQLLAGTVFILSLAAWECSRILRLKAGRTTDQLTRRAYWGRAAVVVTVGVLGLLAFSALLPPVAEAVCHLSPKWHPPQLDANLGPPHRPTQPNADPPDSRGVGEVTQQGADESARTGRMNLPKRVELNLTETPRAYLKFASPEQALTVHEQGPVYLRSFALSLYDHFEWLPSSQDGFWVKDEEDGKQDGHCTVAEDTPQSIHYTMLVPKSDGQALLTLPGLRSVDAPKVYVLPDQWFQLQDTGNIRYGARSDPQIWGRFPSEKTKAADPGLSYLRVPEGRLGDILKRLKDQIFKFHQSPEDCIPALQQFFKSNYTYDTKVENKNNLSPLENFLLDERKGYCDLFATSAALLLRKVGIPTRLGFGYMAGELNQREGIFTFRQRHAHSWVEIMLEGRGWVICEFTPTTESGEGTPGAAADVAQTPNLDEFTDVNAPVKKSAGGAEAEMETPDFFSQLGHLWPSLASKETRLMLILVGVGFAALAWWKRFAGKQTPEEKARRLAAARDQQPAYVQALRDLAESAGITYHLGDTVLELRRALLNHGCDHAEIAKLTKYHYAVRYEDAQPDRRKEAEFVSFLKSLLKAGIGTPATQPAAR